MDEHEARLKAEAAATELASAKDGLERRVEELQNEVSSSLNLHRSPELTSAPYCKLISVQNSRKDAMISSHVHLQHAHAI